MSTGCLSLFKGMSAAATAVSLPASGVSVEVAISLAGMPCF